MAAVSLVSAFVTLVASERDAEAANLNSLASQQRAEEEQAEQQIDAFITQDERLTARYDQALHTYTDSVKEADAVRGTDPARAAQLDLDAQASAAQLAQLGPYFRVLQPTVRSDTSTEYDSTTARRIARFFDWRLFRASSELTQEDARRAADLASSTVLVVVILVAALFLLTLAHVAGGRRGVALAALGVISALGAVVWFAALDVRRALPLLGGAVALMGALALVRTPRFRKRLEGLDQDRVLTDVVEVPIRPRTTATADPDDAPTTRFNRYVAITIAVATLLGAGLGYLQSQASRNSEDQAWSARNRGVEAIGELRAAEESLARDLDAYQLAMITRVDAWNTAQRARYSAWSGDPTLAEHLVLEAWRLHKLAARHQARSGLHDELGGAGVPSVDALNDVRASVLTTPAELAAVQDAANAASRTWGDRAGVYLSVLAWLAVAAYVLGLSLIFRDRRVRLVLSGVGTVLIVATLLRSGTALAQPEPVTGRQAEEAARVYAAGVVASVRGEPEEAEKLFAEAIRQRPSFGIASRERAQAFLEMGSIPGQGFRAAFTEDAVNQAIEELDAAREHGADTAGVFGSLGAMLFHRSIQTNSRADMEESIANTRRSLSLGEAFEKTYGSPHVNQLIGEINLALGLLGTGDVDGAERAYRAVGERIAQLPYYLRPYLVSGGLAPLDALSEAAEAPSAETIEAMKGLLVAQAYGLGTGSGTSPVSSPRAELVASFLQWRAILPGFDPERDRLVVQWYRRDSTLETWSALPIASGPLTFGQLDLGGTIQSDSAAGDDAYSGSTRSVLTDVPPGCVRPGRYKVELYVNDRLQQTAEVTTPPEQDRYVPLLARDIGVALCRPEDWSTVGTRGRSTGALSADESHGIVVFPVHQPRTPDGPGAAIAALERVTEDCLRTLPGDLRAGTGLNAKAPPPPSGSGTSAARVLAYPGGAVGMTATTTSMGWVLVTCTFGSDAWRASEEASALVGSMTFY